jgi:hypothetical protein
MKDITLNRYALSIGAASALLVGCGGSQPPIGPQGVMPQSRAIATHAQRAGSRILPEASGEDLIYSANSRFIYIFSYADGSQIAHAKLPGLVRSFCSDKNGNVFATVYGGAVVKYAHGGTKVIATLGLPSGYEPWGCAVDPSSGDLAVMTWRTPSSTGPGAVALFAHARGSATLLFDSEINAYSYCGYDSGGNLYLDGSGATGQTVFAELSHGSSYFTNIQLNEPITTVGPVQWDGTYVAVQDKTTKIYRVSVSGSTGTIVGTVVLKQKSRSPSDFWIRDGTVVQTGHSPGLWNYPAGGEQIKALQAHWLFGVTVSVAPTH